MNLPDLTKDRKDINWLWVRTLFLTRAGSHSYGTNKKEKELDELYEKSTLPKVPPFEKIDNLLFEVVEEAFRTLPD